MIDRLYMAYYYQSCFLVRKFQEVYPHLNNIEHSIFMDIDIFKENLSGQLSNNNFNKLLVVQIFYCIYKQFWYLAFLNDNCFFQSHSFSNQLLALLLN